MHFYIKGTKYFILCIKKVKLTQNIPGQALREGRAIAVTHLQHSIRRMWIVNTILWPLYPWERYGTHCTGDSVSLRACLNGMENVAPTPRIQFLDCPACNKSLYQ